MYLRKGHDFECLEDTVQYVISNILQCVARASNWTKSSLTHNDDLNLCCISQLMEATAKNWEWRMAWTTRPPESFTFVSFQTRFLRPKSSPWACPSAKSLIFWCWKAKIRCEKNKNQYWCLSIIIFFYMF